LATTMLLLLYNYITAIPCKASPWRKTKKTYPGLPHAAAGDVATMGGHPSSFSQRWTLKLKLLSLSLSLSRFSRRERERERECGRKRERGIFCLDPCEGRATLFSLASDRLIVCKKDFETFPLFSLPLFSLLIQHSSLLLSLSSFLPSLSRLFKYNLYVENFTLSSILQSRGDHRSFPRFPEDKAVAFSGVPFQSFGGHLSAAAAHTHISAQ